MTRLSDAVIAYAAKHPLDPEAQELGKLAEAAAEPSQYMIVEGMQALSIAAAPSAYRDGWDEWSATLAVWQAMFNAHDPPGSDPPID
jgi:hypothetical protein